MCPKISFIKVFSGYLTMNLRSIFLAIMLVISLGFSVDVTSCRNLSNFGTVYNLTQDIVGTNASFSDFFGSGNVCLWINSPSVTLDCGGYSITGNSAAMTYGIASTSGGGNISIVNCNVNNYTVGMHLESGPVNASENEIYENEIGLYIESDPGNTTLVNNTIRDNSNIGVYAHDSTFGNFHPVFINNTIADNTNAGIVFNYSYFLSQNDEISGSDNGLLFLDDSTAYEHYFYGTNLHDNTVDVNVYTTSIGSGGYNKIEFFDVIFGDLGGTFANITMSDTYWEENYTIDFVFFDK